MKIIFYIFVMQIIFYTIHIETSLSNKKILKKAESLFNNINPTTVSNNDEQAYTCLINLRDSGYNYYFEIQQKYSFLSLYPTKKNYDEVVKNAKKITQTEDPKIYEALQATLACLQIHITK